MSFNAVIVVVVAIIIAITMFGYIRKSRTRQINVKFGMEYDRPMEAPGRTASSAEASLRERQKRVESSEI